MNLENQVAITGSTGIAATASALANAGAKLVVGRSVDNLEQLRKEIPDILPIAIDLVKPGAAKEVVAGTLEHFGRLDVLVNIAGISGRKFGDGPVHEASDEGWDTVMDTVMDTNVKTKHVKTKHVKVQF